MSSTGIKAKKNDAAAAIIAAPTDRQQILSSSNSNSNSNSNRKLKNEQFMHHEQHRGQQHAGQQGTQQRNYSTPDRNNRNNNSKSNTNKQQRRNKDPSASPSPRKQLHNKDPPVNVVTSEFASFHKTCQAARYKVHKPGCSCSKITALRQRQRPSAVATTAVKDNDHGSSLQSLLNRLTISETVDRSFLDGLIVVPDIKFIRHVYQCPDTPLASFDRVKDELKLRAEIFDIADTFKVSCAQCLLREEPNGFISVASASKEDVLRVRDLALANQQTKGNLHADHAHFLAVVSQNLLLRHDNRRPPGRSPAKQGYEPSLMVQELQEQGIIPRDYDDDLGQQQQQQQQQPTISFGHHLKALLGMARRRKIANEAKKNSSHSTSSVYWFVLVYQDPNQVWTLDLPGGKRHLGETAIECAIRETEEESSLVWWLDDDDEWTIDERVTCNNDDCNLYFLLRHRQPTRASADAT